VLPCSSSERYSRRNAAQASCWSQQIFLSLGTKGAAHQVEVIDSCFNWQWCCTVLEIRRLIGRKSPIRTHPTLIQRPCSGWPPSNFWMNMISPETKMMGLPYGEKIMIVGQTVWTQSTSVTDRQTDIHTDRITITKTVQRRASHGKNHETELSHTKRPFYCLCHLSCTFHGNVQLKSLFSKLCRHDFNSSGNYQYTR